MTNGLAWRPLARVIILCYCAGIVFWSAGTRRVSLRKLGSSSSYEKVGGGLARQAGGETRCSCVAVCSLSFWTLGPDRRPALEIRTRAFFLRTKELVVLTASDGSCFGGMCGACPACLEVKAEGAITGMPLSPVLKVPKARNCLPSAEVSAHYSRTVLPPI